MTAEIIQFETVVQKPEPAINCSFCGKATKRALTSGDHKSHICPACMVKCDKLIKGDTK